LRDRDGLRAAVRLERLVGPLLLRVNHATDEINVGHPKGCGLGDPQPGDRAQQHSDPQMLRHRIVYCPHLLGGGDVV